MPLEISTKLRRRGFVANSRVRQKAEGYAILLALLFLSLISSALIILTGISNSLGVNTNRELLEAEQRNLAASGKAWVNAHRDSIMNLSAKGRELDTSSLDIPSGKVHLAPTTDGNVTMTAECKRGRLVESEQIPVALP